MYNNQIKIVQILLGSLEGYFRLREWFKVRKWYIGQNMIFFKVEQKYISCRGLKLKMYEVFEVNIHFGKRRGGEKIAKISGAILSL